MFKSRARPLQPHSPGAGTLLNRLFLIPALILLCCSGCSTVSLGYNYADWILRYRITDYTSFSEQQKDVIHLEVDKYMRWHRREALPEYIAFLNNLNAAIRQKDGMTPDDVMRLRVESTRLYQSTVAPMIRPAAHLLSELDNRQIAELAETFADRNRKQREKMITGNTQQDIELRAERHIEFVEDLVGDLSTEQSQKIAEMSRYIPFATVHYIEQREAKQAALITLLKEKAGEDRIDALFRQWLTAPAIFRTQQQQQGIAAYESAMNEMTARIFELLSSRQKQHLTATITSYIQEFEKLNAASEKPLFPDTPPPESTPSGHEKSL